MDVFLVPVGRDRHELYCEVPIEDLAPVSDGAPASWWRRRVDRFKQLLMEAEEERRRREAGHAASGTGAWRWVMRKIAEAVAEQRLLWTLRSMSAADLRHPADLSSAAALDVTRESLRRDYEKHRRWMVIDGLLTLAFLPLTVIPGPNVPSLYFSFRALGHFFSMRGAYRGLHGVTWQPQASVELMSIRQALDLDRGARRARVDELAEPLGLERLGAFVDRVAR
jgi:hypothetical protein